MPDSTSSRCSTFSSTLTPEQTAVVLALTGFAMVISFMTLIMTKRMSAIAALVIVPLVFAVAIGLGGQAGDMVLDGLKQVAPTAIMLVFAILYFGLMIDAGLFDPLVSLIVRWVGSDPLKVTIGQVILTTVVALDGDGTTTLLVCVSALLPIYRRLRMNILMFATIGTMCGSLMNLMPWGGPSARVAAALKLNPAELFAPMLPSIAAGLAATFCLAWWFGVRERARLGTQGPQDGEINDTTDAALDAFQRDPATLRPKLLIPNLILTAALMVAIVAHVAPPQTLFLGAFAVALVLNYPALADQRARIVAHAGSVLNVAVMVLAAGAFTGVLTGSGMIEAMAMSIVAVLPPQVGPYMALIMAGLSMPLSFFLSNDAYYFGVVPVIAQVAQTYGISPAEIGRASLLGQPIHALSPLVAAVYLKCALLGLELVDVQRFVLKWAVGICLVTIIAALASGAIPLRGSVAGHSIPPSTTASTPLR